MISCCVLPHRVAPGATQMACDEAMLDLVASQAFNSMFRTYAWSESTLSLGYFQRFDQALEESRFRDRPIVRRLSGGGALWHDQAVELTYAVVVPESHPLARPSSRLYKAVHAAIAKMLQSFDVPAVRRGHTTGVENPENTGPKPLLCFLDNDADDLLIGPHKIVGSAQRRRGGAVLQHGSILLGRALETPELPGIAELATSSSSIAIQEPMYFQTELKAAIFQALELDPRPVSTNEAEAVAERMSFLSNRYADPAWNRRR